MEPEQINVEVRLQDEFGAGYLCMPPPFQSLREFLLERDAADQFVPDENDCTFVYFMHTLHSACLQSLEDLSSGGEESRVEDLRPRLKLLIRDLCCTIGLNRKTFEMDSYSLSLGTIRSTLGTLCMVVLGYLIQFYFSSDRKLREHLIKMRDGLKRGLFLAVPSLYLLGEEEHESMWSRYDCECQLSALKMKWWRLDAANPQLAKFIFFLHMQCQSCWIADEVEDEIWRDNCYQTLLDMYSHVSIFWLVNRVSCVDFVQREFSEEDRRGVLPEIFHSVMREEGAGGVEHFFRRMDQYAMNPFLDNMCNTSMDDTMKMYIRELYMRVCLRPGEQVLYTRNRITSDNIPTKRILSEFRTSHEVDIIREHSLMNMYSGLNYQYGESGYWMEMLKFEPAHVGTITILYLVGQWIQSSAGHDFIHVSTLLFPQEILKSIQENGDLMDVHGLKWPYIVRICGQYYVLYGRDLIYFDVTDASRYEEGNRMSQVMRVVLLWFLLVCKHIEVGQASEFTEVFSTIQKLLRKAPNDQIS